MSVWSQDPNFVFINAGADIQPASQTDKAVQALYDTYGSKNVLAVKAYGNVDAAPDSSARLVPNGMVVVHPAEAIIQPDSISDSMFQHLMVFPVSRGIKGEVPLKDADFVNEEARARLNEAVPQFSSRPPSMSLRSRMNNGDTENWDAELGQDHAMAGIYRVTAENGRDHKYEIHVLAGAENVASELRAYLSKLPEESKPTFDQFLNSQEMSYARAISEENCKRIGYAVARALKVNISQIRSEMSFTPASTSFAKPLRAEPKINQPVSSIMRVEYPQRVAVAVFSGVTPIQRCSDRFVVAGSAYDANIGFRMPMDRDQRIDSLGLPVMMARTKPSDALSPLAPKEVAHRTQHLIWEGKLPSGMHPSAHPEAFASPIGRSFLDTMEKHGWSRKEHFDSAVPVLVKISNPMMKRGK